MIACTTTPGAGRGLRAGAPGRRRTARPQHAPFFRPRDDRRAATTARFERFRQLHRRTRDLMPRD